MFDAHQPWYALMRSAAELSTVSAAQRLAFASMMIVNGRHR
jgi:hypothetical protein